MKQQFFDINKLPVNGYLVFPLSMSRLQTGQSPEKIYDALVFFNKKIPKISLDVVFLYTNGLYMNTEEKAIVVRQKTTNQMLNHRNALMSLILKKREFVPQAFHFETWDNILLNADKFVETVNALKNLRLKSPDFRKHLEQDLKDKEKTETNFNFLIEEIAITHLLRQKFVPLPHTLASSDGWRLIVYAGDPMQADIFAFNKHKLPKNKEIKKDSVYSRAQYDLDKKVLIDFDKLHS